MKDNGGYVYPRRLPGIMLPPDEAAKCVDNHSGKALRDDFAGQALVHYNSQRKSMHEQYGDLSPDDIDNIIAKACYCMADAMIEEKRKTE